MCSVLACRLHGLALVHSSDQYTSTAAARFVLLYCCVPFSGGSVDEYIFLQARRPLAGSRHAPSIPGHSMFRLCVISLISCSARTRSCHRTEGTGITDSSTKVQSLQRRRRGSLDFWRPLPGGQQQLIHAHNLIVSFCKF